MLTCSIDAAPTFPYSACVKHCCRHSFTLALREETACFTGCLHYAPRSLKSMAWPYRELAGWETSCLTQPNGTCLIYLPRISDIADATASRSITPDASAFILCWISLIFPSNPDCLEIKNNCQIRMEDISGVLMIMRRQREPSVPDWNSKFILFFCFSLHVYCLLLHAFILCCIYLHPNCCIFLPFCGTARRHFHSRWWMNYLIL